MPSSNEAFYTRGSIHRTMFKTALAMLAGMAAAILFRMLFPASSAAAEAAESVRVIGGLL